MTPIKAPIKKLMFVILGGWGVRAEGQDNAFSGTKAPYLKELLSNYPAAVLSVPEVSRRERFSAISGQPPFIQTLVEAGARKLFISETERAAYLFESLRSHVATSSQDSFITIPSMLGGYEDEPVGMIKELETQAVKALKDSDYDFVALDLSTVDLMMEYGDIGHISKTITRVDEALRKIGEAALDKDWVLVIASYGGNAEKIKDIALDMDDRGLTNSPVPFIVVGRDFYGRSLGSADAPSGDLSTLSPVGNLSDIGPAILDLMGLGNGESIAAGLV